MTIPLGGSNPRATVARIETDRNVASCKRNTVPGSISSNVETRHLWCSTSEICGVKYVLVLSTD